MVLQPEITVVIPTRDRWSYLTAALASALEQEDVSHEVVVVDDGSIDETHARLSHVKDERLGMIRHERPRGVAVARNSGISAAKGEWIAFLDDDDVWSPQKLRTQLKAAKAGDASFVYSGVALFDECGNTRIVLAPDPIDLKRKLLANYVVPAAASNVVAKTSLVRSVGGFDHELVHLADWDFLLKLAAEGQAAATSEVLVGCREHATNMHVVGRASLFRDFDYLVEKHRTASTTHGIDFDGVTFSRGVAGSHRRAGNRIGAASAYFRGAIRYGNAGNALRAIGVLFGAKLPNWRVTRRERTTDAPSWLNRYRNSAAARSNTSVST